MMAGADTFEIKVKGKGGHGALPNKTIDPIVTAAQIVTATQTIVSRNISPFDTSVVSFCSINGGSAFNVIPPDVILKGTIRTFDVEVRSTIINRFEEIVIASIPFALCLLICMIILMIFPQIATWLPGRI